MNRNAQIGATFTWVLGFVIIFFVIILFLSATAILAGTKQLPVVSWFAGGNSISSVSTSQSSSLAVEQELMGFLKSKIVYKESEVSAEALFESSLKDREKDKIDLFKQNGEKFFGNNLNEGEGVVLKVYSDSNALEEYSFSKGEGCSSGPRDYRAEVFSGRYKFSLCRRAGK